MICPLSEKRSRDVIVANGLEEAHAVEGILAVRWWSLDELRTTKERVFPEDLVRRVENSSVRGHG